MNTDQSVISAAFTVQTASVQYIVETPRQETNIT